MGGLPLRVDQRALPHEPGVEVIDVELGPRGDLDQRLLLRRNGAFAAQVGDERTTQSSSARARCVRRSIAASPATFTRARRE